jgi:hypothetical protein
MDFKEQTIEIINNFPKQIVEGKLLVIKIFINTIIKIIIENWVITIIIFLSLFIISVLDIFINYDWRLLSKILYRISYLGILLTVILVFGIEVLVSEWVKVILFIIGTISFEIVGLFLRKVNFR